MIPFILIFQSGKEVYPTSSLLLVVDSGRFCAGIIIGFSRIGVQAPKRHLKSAKHVKANVHVASSTPITFFQTQSTQNKTNSQLLRKV